MTIALLLVLWALRIRDYEAVNDGRALIEHYKDWPSQEQFLEDRVIDYAVASHRNRVEQ